MVGRLAGRRVNRQVRGVSKNLNFSILSEQLYSSHFTEGGEAPKYLRRCCAATNTRKWGCKLLKPLFTPRVRICSQIPLNKLGAELPVASQVKESRNTTVGLFTGNVGYWWTTFFSPAPLGKSYRGSTMVMQYFVLETSEGVPKRTGPS